MAVQQLPDDIQEAVDAHRARVGVVAKQLDSLTRTQLQALVAAATPRMNRYILHKPTAKQRAAMLLNHIRDGFYGGAAGGGKSDWLLAEALQYVDVPGYSAILFRKTYRDLALPGGLMDRAKDWLTPTDAHWNEADHRWDFPGGGSLIFGYMEHEDDKRRYQSAEFQFVGFDEMTHFTETMATFMFTRLRRLATSTIPIRFRGASNPGGIGHEWVKQRYLVEGPERPDRFFIKARLQDNPHIDQAEYISALGEADPVTLGQMLRGDWEAVPEGRKFKREWLAGRILPTCPPLVKAIRYWDVAGTEPTKKKKDPDWTVGLGMGLTRLGQIVVFDRIKRRGVAGEIEEIIGVTADADGRRVKIGMEQEPGSSGKSVISHYRRNVLPEYIFEGHQTTGSKEERANPFFGRCFAGDVSVVQGSWVNDYLNHLEAFPDKDWHDDDVDATSGAYEMLVGRRGPASIRII